MARKTKEEALKTRQLLLDSAIEQFALRGVSNTTLTDIADAAGVTRILPAKVNYLMRCGKNNYRCAT